MSSTPISTRDRILKASWKLLEQGAGTPVRLVDIAEEAGVSRQALYLLFENRANLVRATRVYVDEIHGVGGKVDRILALGAAKKMLKAYIEFWADYLPEIAGLARAMQIGGHTDKAAAQAWQDCLDEHFEVCFLIASKLEQERALSKDWTAQAAAEMIFATVSLDSWAELVLWRDWSGKSYSKRTYELLINGLARIMPD